MANGKTKETEPMLSGRDIILEGKLKAGSNGHGNNVSPGLEKKLQ